MTQRKALTDARGFSLLESLVALVVMSIMMTAVLSQIGQIQQRARTEQIKLDIFQQSREFMDQFDRDLRQAGYPTLRMFDTNPADGWSPALASPSTGDTRIAVGVIKIAANEIEFEGDVDGDGQVDVVDYQLVSSGDGCPCLQRSQILKSSSTTVFSTQIQNIQSAGTSSDPIFIAYKGDGTSVTSADMTTTTGQQDLAGIKTVQFTVKVKADVVDPQTRVAPETSLAGQVLLRNCSLASSGQYNSCS